MYYKLIYICRKIEEMKNVMLIILMLVSLNLHPQMMIKGIVADAHNSPLAYANISIEGTIDGTTSEEDGKFALETSEKGTVVLKVTMLGYDEYKQTISLPYKDSLHIILKQSIQALKEVTISSGGFRLKGGSSMEQKNAVELVTVAGSEGDLFKSLGMLSGVQVSGTDGKLLVRGGDSRESQTYIDGMHVMNAYTTMPENVSSRSRYSPFLFEGMSFEQGAYSSEYSQGLSSVLPLTTKDKSLDTKIGAQILTVGLGSGGTKAWKDASTSFNFDYTDMGPYNDVFYPKERNNRWTKPYRSFAGQNQFRFSLGKYTTLKTYATYAKTTFNMLQKDAFSDSKRDLNMNEDNLYLNSTLKTRTDDGINFFIGGAFSYNNQTIKGGRVAYDKVGIKESEIHLKSKLGKRFSSLYKLEGGIETFINKYDFSYRDTTLFKDKMNHTITGAYVSNDFIITSNFYVNASLRGEYTSINKSWNILPRVALNYESNGLTLLAAYGKYQQLADKDYLLFNHKLDATECEQFVTGAYYRDGARTFRIELYHKNYDNLTTGNNYRYQSGGKGFSNGIDVFVNDRKFLKRWEYMISYSYNNSKRMYSDYNEMVSPTYSTKHNAAVVLKYDLFQYKTFLGVTNRFASGRPYHDPNKSGVMNAETKPYYALDLCATFLLHPRFIVYTSVSNILNRTNVYGYQYSAQENKNGKFDRIAKVPYQNQFFLVGFFLTIGGKDAYNPSNF